MNQFSTTNDAFLYLADKIFNHPQYEISPRGQATRECLCVSLEITNPFERYIQNIARNFSLKYALGEWLWYERASNNLNEIAYYSKFWRKISDDGVTVNSAYGYRIYGIDPSIGVNQWQSALDELKKDQASRRAIITIISPVDMGRETKDFPCTISLQFFIRNRKLHLSVNMRSNDLVLGFSYDVFTFTMFQEKMLLQLKQQYPDLKMGSYYHFTGSMHIYERDFDLINEVLATVDENYDYNLPPMKSISAINDLQHNERIIRTSGNYEEFRELNDEFAMTCQYILIEK